MKALVLKEYNYLSYENVPDPECRADDVIVGIKACGICGSDVHGMDGSTGRRIPPLIMGHEASGVIKEVGSNVKNWKPGDRVTFDSTIYPLDDWYTKEGYYNLSDNRQVIGVSCDEYKREGAFAEYLAVPRHILHRIPDSVIFNQAALAEPAAVAMHAVNLTPVSLADTAVVIGTGVIGLFVVQILKLKECSQVIAVDIQQSHLELASRFGADFVLNADNQDVIREIYTHTKDRGADIAFEVVGQTSTFQTAIDSIRKGGTITLIGNISDRVDLPLQSIVTRQIRLQGSCAICGEYPDVLNLIGEGKINVDDMISVTAPLSEGSKWFSRLYNKDPELMKVILNP